jgi:hypothetical protein
MGEKRAANVIGETISYASEEVTVAGTGGPQCP